MTAIAATRIPMVSRTTRRPAADVGYPDLGGDYYTRRNPDRTKQRALNQLRQLGYNVTASRYPSWSTIHVTAIFMAGLRWSAGRSA